MGVTETPEKGQTEIPDQDTIEKELKQSQKCEPIVFSRRTT